MHDPTPMDPREPASRAADAWPAVVFDAPVLRGLDARARREIEGAGRVVHLAEGGVVYRAGDEGASFFVVASGKVAIRAVRRGEGGESELRAAGPGDSFGEESTVGLGRRATAVALLSGTVAEIPVHVFRRAAERSGTADIAARLERGLARTATADLLRTIAFTRDLGPRDLDVLLDVVTRRRVERGQPVYRQGDPATELFLIADGMVQIQVEEGDRLHVRAYLGRGDFFGDVEIHEACARQSSAVASGPSLLLALPSKVFVEMAARYPQLLPGLRRVAEDQEAAQRARVGKAAANATQHVFRDLYRLQVARSLLVIDLESCARCGHCAWACSEMYGVARLVRRGDKVVARVDGHGDGEAPQHLMLPNSCQHCENPACMVGCPTGAIGRDPGGEVFIREELCTGCGACAKACPWDNIQMASRPLGTPAPAGGKYEELAVKCDLCRGYEGPACVQACPTGSIFRLNPSEEIADVRALFRDGGATSLGPGAPAHAPAGVPLLVPGAAIGAAGIALAGVMMHGRGLWQPARGVGLGAGVLAAAGMLALLAYAIPKRRIRLWMKPRARGSEARGAEPNRRVSVVRPQLQIHLALGLATLGLVFAHARPRAGGGHGSALLTALVITSIAGGLTAAAYRWIPPRLSRLERTAALPEDFARARQDLLDRLYREASGKSDLVKKILEKILLPYVRSPLGPLALLASGRRLREEETALRARVDEVLEGRGKERLAGLAELCRIVVELRALPAQRWLLYALRVWLPVHIVTFALAVALLGVHVALALRGRW
jgi:Fe-S-cluster-containing dehydrogenase component/CRP-like cAMP-binding protein